MSERGWLKVIIGVPKEIKEGEHRVAMTPAGAAQLAGAGHRVVIERGAGEGSGFADVEYERAGAVIAPRAEDVWSAADMIVKVKEPLEGEYPLIRENQILFCFLHLAASPELASVLREKKVTGIACETVQLADGSLPLLAPMSEVAGRLAVQLGARLLEKTYGGRGILLGGVPGVPPAEVVIVGGGIVGTQAAKMAAGLGAGVVVIEKSAERLRRLDDLFGGRVRTLLSSPQHIREAARNADLLIGAVLVPGARAPRLVTEETVREMKKGAVIVDVAVDQGGCVETVDRTTSYGDPAYVRHGVVHAAVPNLPGAVPRTSTLAFAGATLPYILEIADKELENALAANEPLRRGVNTFRGSVTHAAAAEAVGAPYTPLGALLDGGPVRFENLKM